MTKQASSILLCEGVVQSASIARPIQLLRCIRRVLSGGHSKAESLDIAAATGWLVDSRSVLFFLITAAA